MRYRGTQFIKTGGVILCVMLGFNAHSQTDSEVTKSIERIVFAEVKYDLFSGAILVAQEGEIIYSGAFGFADRDKNVPNELTTKFNIGSIGKTFTAVLIMQLVEDRKIKLTDTLNKYLPDFPHPEKNIIQIYHLLTHSSGLGNYFSHRDYEKNMHTLRAIDDALPLVYDQEILFEPGTQYRYSNSGMLVLGAIIERISGMSYRQYLKENILKSAGMKNSGIFYPEEAVDNRAIGYSKIDEGRYKVETEREFPAFSDGGLYATVGDMLKYDRALISNKLLDEKTKEMMFMRTGPNKNYALGWEVGAFMGEKFVGHVGGCYGFAADYVRFPEKQIMVIVMSNYTETGLELAAKIKQLVITGGKSTIPLATQYDFNFKKGRNLSEVHKRYREAVLYLDQNILADEPHMPSLFATAQARIRGQFEIDRALELLNRYLFLGEGQSNRTKAAVWWLKGQAYELLSDEAIAIECYEKSVFLHPEFDRAKKSLQKLKEKK